MTRPSIDDLEMELRVLGRRLGEEAPSKALVSNTIAISAAHLSVCAQRINRRRQLRLLLGTAALAAATLPIPLLFLWGDWAAASALFARVLSPGASEIASSVYLWIRFCGISLTYIILIGMLAWWSFRSYSAASNLPEVKEV